MNASSRTPEPPLEVVNEDTRPTDTKPPERCCSAKRPKTDHESDDDTESEHDYDHESDDDVPDAPKHVPEQVRRVLLSRTVFRSLVPTLDDVFHNTEEYLHAKKTLNDDRSTANTDNTNKTNNTNPVQHFFRRIDRVDADRLHTFKRRAHDALTQITDEDRELQRTGHFLAVMLAHHTFEDAFAAVVACTLRGAPVV